VTLDNGTALDLEGSSGNALASLTLIDRSITDGSIAATSYDLQNGSTGANLAGPLTMSPSPTNAKVYSGVPH
jgi:hypothetical protein